MSSSSLKILGITDLHGDSAACSRLLEFCLSQGIQLVLFAGDLESIPLLDQLLRFPQVLAVPGNMDSKELIRKLEPINIHGKSVRIGELEICGIGGHPHRLDLNLFSPSSSQLILVTHKPPYGILDRTFSGKHIGSNLINAFLQRFRPRICLCGHAHESPGMVQLEGCLILNPGPAYLGRAALIDPVARSAQLLKI